MPQIRAPPTAQHHRSFPAPSTATRLGSYTGGVRWPTLRTAHGTTGAITALNPVRPSPSCRCREVCHRHQCPGTRPPDRCLQHRRTTPRVSVRSPRGSSAWCSSCSALCWPSHLVSRRSFWGSKDADRHSLRAQGPEWPRPACCWGLVAGAARGGHRRLVRARDRSRILRLCQPSPDAGRTQLRNAANHPSQIRRSGLLAH